MSGLLFAGALAAVSLQLTALRFGSDEARAQLMGLLVALALLGVVIGGAYLLVG